MEYLNFHIRLTANNGNSLQKVIIDAPAGHGESDMHLPLHDAGFQEMFESLWNVLLNIRSSFRATPQQEKAAQAVGKTLFTSLFRDEMLHLYDDSLRKANELPDAGLLLRFEIEEPALAILPWELLYDERESKFITCYRDTPVVRTLPQPLRDLAPLTTQPLRMLCMVANPDGHAHLDVKREKQHLHEALQELEDDGSIEIHWIAGQTWRDLQEAMRTNEWHIFHFTGHGSFDEQAEHGKGSLTFASEHGGPQILTAEKVAQLLSGHSSLRLVILNACEGARTNAQDIFSSTAATLLSQSRSLMAVLAMQTKITDRAALLFTRTFYAALAKGVPVETAVTEARIAIGITMPKTLEWATPVLYTHSPLPILFTMKQAQRIEAGTLQYTCRDTGGSVRSIAWSPNGACIASSSDNGPVQIRESATGTVLTSYRDHTSTVQAVAWSPVAREQEERGNTSIASASLDGSIHIWNAATGQQRLKLILHRIPSLDPRTITIAWSPDGQFIAAGSNNEQVKIWNAETGQLTITYREHSHSGNIVPKLGWILALAWSPDGRYIVSGGGGYNLKSTGFGEAWLFDKSVHVWDAHTGKRISTYDAHTKSVTSLAWSPDGRFIASADRNGQVHVWEPDSLTPAHIFGEHKKVVNALTWSPDSSCLASASDDTTVRIRHVATRNELYTYRGHTCNVNAVAWSPDGKFIASGGNEKTIHIWQAPSTHVRPIKNQTTRANANPPDFSYARQGDLIYKYDTHANWVSAVAWSPDGTRIASSGGDATVRIWNPANGENLLTYHGQAGRLSEVLTVAWSPDSTRIASGGNRATIQIWNADNKQLLAEYEGHSKLAGVPYVGHVFWAVWSPDSESIASTSINLGLDKAVHIWNAATGTLRRKFDLRSGLVDTSSAGGVAWSPDGTRIAAGMRGEVRIFNIKTGAQVLTYKQHPGYISAITWSPDGERIASMNGDSVQVWNATTGDFYYAYRGHTDSLRDVAWSPDGQYLASASNDRTVQLCTANDGTRIFTYIGHTDEVGAVSWAPDSQRIASASKDKTVHIWQAIRAL